MVRQSIDQMDYIKQYISYIGSIAPESNMITIPSQKILEEKNNNHV